MSLQDLPTATEDPPRKPDVPGLACPSGQAPRRYKIVLFIPHLRQGGAERQILALCARLPRNFEPILCVADDRIHYGDLPPADQPRYILGNRRMGPKAMRRLAAVLEKEKPEIPQETVNLYEALLAEKGLA